MSVGQALGKAVTSNPARRTSPALSVTATVVGLWLGLGAPDVSPVAPTAAVAHQSAMAEAPASQGDSSVGGPDGFGRVDGRDRFDGLDGPAEDDDGVAARRGDDRRREGRRG